MKQRRGSRRFVIQAGIFLLLGAIVNIAVASICVIRSRLATETFDTGLLTGWYRHPGEFWAEPESDAESRALVAAFELWPQLAPDTPAPTYEQFTVQYWNGWGVSIISGFADRDTNLHSDDFVRVWSQRYTSGWPMQSFAAFVDRSGALNGGIIVPASWLAPDRAEMFVHWDQPQVQGIVPMIPLWPGFAINTLFYAAILWLLFALPGALRRWRRVKRGLCPACAYPIGTSDLCTECGKPVTRRPHGTTATS